jgi:uncharacterized protein (DUF302 family)
VKKSQKQSQRRYVMYFGTLLDMPFAEAREKTIEAFSREGFGVLTEIDVKATLKKKLDVDFRHYIILGMCNPPFAHRALLLEDKVGLMMPCNVIMQQQEGGKVEVAAVDPLAIMPPAGKQELTDLAKGLQEKVKRAVDSL